MEDQYYDQFPHLREPLRLQIGSDYLKSEFRKLLKGMRDTQVWNSIDEHLIPLEESRTMTILTFWNLVTVYSAYIKSKIFTPLLTSENIRWTNANLPLSKIRMTTKANWTQMDGLKKERPTGQEIKVFFHAQHNADLLKAEFESSKDFSDRSFNRDDHPIIVKKMNNHYEIIDGNRRLVNAAINQENSLECFIAEQISDPRFKNHWVAVFPLIHSYKKAVKSHNTNNVKKANMICDLIGASLKNTKVGFLGFIHQLEKSNNLISNTELISRISNKAGI